MSRRLSKLATLALMSVASLASCTATSDQDMKPVVANAGASARIPRIGLSEEEILAEYGAPNVILYHGPMIPTYIYSDMTFDFDEHHRIKSVSWH